MITDPVHFKVTSIPDRSPLLIQVMAQSEETSVGHGAQIEMAERDSSGNLGSVMGHLTLP